jgi:hypothetical protein
MKSSNGADGIAELTAGRVTPVDPGANPPSSSVLSTRRATDTSYRFRSSFAFAGIGPSAPGLLHCR